MLADEAATAVPAARPHLVAAAAGQANSLTERLGWKTAVKYGHDIRNAAGVGNIRKCYALMPQL